MEIKRLINSITRMLWLIVLLSAVGGSIGWYSTLHSIPFYVAKSTVYAMSRSRVGTSGVGLSSQDIIVSRNLIQDYSGIVNSKAVTSLAMAHLKGMNLTEESLSRMVSIELEKDSSIMDINAVSTDPKVAAAVANAMAKGFTTRLHQLTNSDIVGILDEAKLPETPIPVDNTKNILIGILAGMAIGFAAIYIIELFDTTVRAAEDVEDALKLNVIGIIPEFSIR